MGLRSALATHRPVQGQGCLGLLCRRAHHWQWPPRLSSAPATFPRALVLTGAQILCGQRSEQAARFGRSSVVSLVKSFLWLLLLGLRKYRFYSPLLFLPDANKLFKICLQCCFSKEREMFWEFCSHVSLRWLRFGLGRGLGRRRWSGSGEGGWYLFLQDPHLPGIVGQELEGTCIPQRWDGSVGPSMSLWFMGWDSLSLDSLHDLERVTSPGLGL